MLRRLVIMVCLDWLLTRICLCDERCGLGGWNAVALGHYGLPRLAAHSHDFVANVAF